MNRLINKKMDQSEALASAIVELSDKELEMVVGGGGSGCGGDFACPAHRDNDCDRGHGYGDYDRNRKRCGRDGYGLLGHRESDLVSDLLGLL